MTLSLIKAHRTWTYKLFSLFVVLVFLSSLCVAPSAVYAQSTLNLPAPGTIITTSPVYSPAMMAGIIIDPQNPLQLGFVIGTGDDRLKGEEFKKEANKLINYFLATLTVPEDEMWVNLSPYEKDRIIAEGLSATEMGRDMLAQDYLLKQLTASLMYPEEELGDEFWRRVYEKAQARIGNTDIPANTFNKVWIVPDAAAVYINGTNVFVNKSHLKVMLEEDYLAQLTTKDEGRETRDESSIVHRPSSIVTNEIIREIILPEIEKEVNEGKNFANLRQIYQSMILAAWYKKNLKESVLGGVYMDMNKTEGIDLEDKQIKEKIYNQYVEAFKKGVYDYIRDEYDPATQEIVPRKYFSGGLKNVDAALLAREVTPSDGLRRSLENSVVVGVDFRPVNERGEAMDETDQAMAAAGQRRRDFLTNMGVVLAGGILGRQALTAQAGPNLLTALRNLKRLRTQDPSGFRIGGVNTSAELRGMMKSGVNNRSFEEIERSLRQDAILGKLMSGQSLEERLRTNNVYILNNGLTHQRLAEPLIDALIASSEGRQEFTFNGKQYRVAVSMATAKGFDISAFGDEDIIGFNTYQVTDVSSGNTLEFQQGQVFYIYKYGHYSDGLVPTRLRNFFMPAITFNSGNAAGQPIKMDYRRQMTRAEIDQRINEVLSQGAIPGILFSDPLGDGALRFQIRSPVRNFGSSSTAYYTSAFAAFEGRFYVASLDPNKGNATDYVVIDAPRGEIREGVPVQDLPAPIRQQFGITADRAMTAQEIKSNLAALVVVRGGQIIEANDLNEYIRSADEEGLKVIETFLLNTIVDRADNARYWIEIRRRALQGTPTYAGGDSAMTAADNFTKGGIDFNPDMLDLTEEGQPVNFTIDNSILQNLPSASVYGIQPVIINIMPVTNFMLLLGLTDKTQEEQLSQIN